jgi:hypothetical protein
MIIVMEREATDAAVAAVEAKIRGKGWTYTSRVEPSGR